MFIKKEKRHKPKRSIIAIIFRLFLIVLLVVFVRVFVCETYIVSSGSMEDTLHEGDFFVVNKLCLGPRLPSRPKDIPLIGFFCYSSSAKNWYVNTTWKYRRMVEYSSLKRNELIVFDKPDEDKRVIKRCIGVPGDTIEIKQNVRYANGVIQEEPPTVKFSFCIVLKEASTSLKFLEESVGLKECNFLWRNRDSFHYSLNMGAAQAIKRRAIVDTVFMDLAPKGAPGPQLFTNSPAENHTRENYGPIVIPKKGVTTELRMNNIGIYKNAMLMDDSSLIITVENRIIKLNGRPVSRYTFKNNYYFVAGDNRHQSVDSRYWGFLPENSIIGKVVFTYHKR